MDIQLKELIEKIESEGVQVADRKGKEIIAKAEEKAAGIIADAEMERDRMLANARNEAAKLERTGKEALAQASRDLVLDLKIRITAILKNVVERETAAVFTTENLAEAVVAVVKNWSSGAADDLSVLLNPDQLAAVESLVADKLAAELKSGLEIKPFPQIDAGFRVSEKDGTAYYNFTAEGISEILVEFLNPRIAEILKEQDK